MRDPGFVIHSSVWLVSALLAAQSLGEVADRERKRREQNAEAGIEATAYTVQGEAVTSRDPREPSTPEPRGEEQPESGSPLGAERERGKILEPRVAEISRAADGVDGLYRRYMDTCHNRYLIGVTPPNFGIPVASPSPLDVEMARGWSLDGERRPALAGSEPHVPERSIVLVQSPECQALRGDLIAAVDEVKRAMQELLEEARRQRILPGVVRELLRKYRLG